MSAFSLEKTLIGSGYIAAIKWIASLYCFYSISDIMNWDSNRSGALRSMIEVFDLIQLGGISNFLRQIVGHLNNIYIYGFTYVVMVLVASHLASIVYIYHRNAWQEMYLELKDLSVDIGYRPLGEIDPFSKIRSKDINLNKDPILYICTIFYWMIDKTFNHTNRCQAFIVILIFIMVNLWIYRHRFGPYAKAIVAPVFIGVVVSPFQWIFMPIEYLNKDIYPDLKILDANRKRVLEMGENSDSFNRDWIVQYKDSKTYQVLDYVYFRTEIQGGWVDYFERYDESNPRHIRALAAHECRMMEKELLPQLVDTRTPLFYI